MKKIIRYNATVNKPNRPQAYDLIVECSSADFMAKIDPAFIERAYPYEYSAILERLKKTEPKPKRVELCGFTSLKEATEVLSLFKESVETLSLFKCPDLEDLSFLEELPNLKHLEMYWNRKATKVFDASRMPNFKRFEVCECNKLVDFSGLKNSKIERLVLCGTSPSCFTPKLDVGDMEFLEYMPKLKYLNLVIMRTQSDEHYLKTLAKVKSLEELDVGSNFFTFEQFAWLSAHLPNVKSDLEPCTYYISQLERGTEIVPEVEEYFVIGRHKTYVKTEKAIKYRDAYNRLRAEYADQPEPPSRDFKIKV